MTTTPLEVQRAYERTESESGAESREGDGQQQRREDDDDASAVFRRRDLYLRIVVEKSLLVDSASEQAQPDRSLL